MMAYSEEKAYMKEIRSHFWVLVVPSSLHPIDPLSLLYAISYNLPELVMVTKTYERKGNSACCNLLVTIATTSGGVLFQDGAPFLHRNC